MAEEFVNVESYNPGGTGWTDDGAALQAAFDAARHGVLVFPDSNKVYATSRPLRIHESTRLINAGAELRTSAPLGTTAVVARAGFRADFLRIGVAKDAQVSPALELNSDSSISRLEIRSWQNQQQANRNAGEFGLRITGSHTSLGCVSVTGFDNAVGVTNAAHVAIGRIHIDRYLKGLYLSNCRFFELTSGTVTGVGSPLKDYDTHEAVNGLNGLLIEDSTDLVVSDLIVHDSVEHGVRIGGTRVTERCMFNNVQIWRAGKCGFKVQPGGTKLAKAIHINGLLVLDCAPMLPIDGPVTMQPGEREAQRYEVDALNRCGLRLEACQDVVVNGLQVGRNRNAWYSSFHGLYIARSRNVTVNAPHVGDTYQAGIRLSEGSPPETAAVNEIYIRNPVVTFLVPEAHANPVAEADGIWIDSPTRPLRNIVITGCYIRGHSGYGLKVRPSDQAPRAPWPVILQGWVKNEGKGVVWPDGPTDADIHMLIETV